MTKVIDLLHKAYESELETMNNYLALSENLTSYRGKQVSEEFESDIAEELEHAKQLASRIRDKGYTVHYSENMYLDEQPYTDAENLTEVIKQAIKEEQNAIELYTQLIEESQKEDDYVTEDLAIELLEDEEHHKRELEEYLENFSQ